MLALPRPYALHLATFAVCVTLHYGTLLVIHNTHCRWLPCRCSDAHCALFTALRLLFTLPIGWFVPVRPVTPPGSYRAATRLHGRYAVPGLDCYGPPAPLLFVALFYAYYPRCPLPGPTPHAGIRAYRYHHPILPFYRLRRRWPYCRALPHTPTTHAPPPCTLPSHHHAYHMPFMPLLLHPSHTPFAFACCFVGLWFWFQFPQPLYHITPLPLPWCCLVERCRSSTCPGA